MTYFELVKDLIKRGYLKTQRIIEAFKKIDRADFLLPEFKEEAWLDAPLPIGFGQTISQPLTVAFMMELLQPRAGDRVLDVGAGSGWTTAILAYIVSQNGNSKSEILNPKQIQNSNFKIQKREGKVIAIEIVSELKEFGEKNVAKYNFIKKRIVEFICGDGSEELKGGGLFDKILAGAACQKIPQAWKEQLRVGGRLVTPVQSSIWLLIKKGENKFEEQEFPGFAFVPLVAKNKQ